MDILPRAGGLLVLVLAASASAGAASANVVTLQCDNGAVVTVDFDRGVVDVTESWGLHQQGARAVISDRSIKFTEEWDRNASGYSGHGGTEHVAVPETIDRQSGVMSDNTNGTTVCHPAKNAF